MWNMLLLHEYDLQITSRRLGSKYFGDSIFNFRQLIQNSAKTCCPILKMSNILPIIDYFQYKATPVPVIENRQYFADFEKFSIISNYQ